MADVSVKHFHSALPGAPVLNGQAGSLIAVLDSCLVNGFGSQLVSSAAVAGGVATYTVNTGHAFAPDVIALVDGATPAALNGQARVLSTTATTVQVDATGVPDGAVTGTVTIKLAPAGWTKVFSGTNLAVYRTPDVEATRMFLRVDDTSGRNARVVGYESMTDVNTGAGAFPAAAQISGGGYWPKADSTSASARAWTIVADIRTFRLHMHTTASSPGVAGSVWHFGDFDSVRSGDPYACALFCAASDQSSSSAVQSGACEFLNGANAYIPRSYVMISGSVAIAHTGEALVSNSNAGTVAVNVPTYPNYADNALVLMRKVLVEPAASLRGRLRGLWLPMQNCHAAFAWRDKVSGQGALVGRKLMAIKCGGPASTVSAGVVFEDITGPW